MSVGERGMTEGLDHRGYWEVIRALQIITCCAVLSTEQSGEGFRSSCGTVSELCIKKIDLMNVSTIHDVMEDHE